MSATSPSVSQEQTTVEVLPVPIAVAPTLKRLPYLDSQMEDLSDGEKLSVHYRIVGAASVWLDEARWRSVVDTAVANTKAMRP